MPILRFGLRMARSRERLYCRVELSAARSKRDREAVLMWAVNLWGRNMSQKEKIDKPTKMMSLNKALQRQQHNPPLSRL